MSLVFVAVVYVTGLLLVWRYETRKTKLHQLVLAEIELLRNSGLSMAMVHAKMFKWENDYQQWLKMVEAKQQFIFEKVLFLKKSSLTTKNKNSYCFQV